MWTSSKTDKEKLLNNLNAKQPSIKFKCEISKERIFFQTARYILKTTSYIPRYLERKQTRELFLTWSIHIV